MFWDLMVLITDPVGQMKAYGGLSPYVLFLFHHTLSIAAWPYAVSAGRRLFCQLLPRLEVTASTCPLFPPRRARGQPSVFLERHPPLLRRAWRSSQPGRSVLEQRLVRVGARRDVGRAAAAYPVGLNVYWFGLIVSTAVKYILTGSEDGAPTGWAQGVQEEEEEEEEPF